jgi:15-cis-phytoene synthase
MASIDQHTRQRRDAATSGRDARGQVASTRARADKGGGPATHPPRASRAAFGTRVGGSHARAPRQAYRHCEQITRTQARNFYYGIRLLPVGKRQAMCAVYAFARRVDDIGDGSLAGEEKLRRLDRLAEALAELGGAEAPDDDDSVLVALDDAARRFPLPRDALQELLEGVRMDVLDVSYERFDELALYCRRVAGGIGRLCLAIFGTKDARAGSWSEAAADELGVALQLTNILRDVREDAARGRVYLPHEDLARFGLISATAPGSGDAGAAGSLPSGFEDARHARRRESEQALLSLIAAAEAAGAGAIASTDFDAMIEFEVQRARVWYARGVSLLEQLDWRSSACVLAMVGIYRRLLERIDASPSGTLRGRLSLTRTEKLWVATQSMLAG